MNVRKPTEEEIKEFSQLPIWEKEESNFDWEYNATEQCLIIEGEARVANLDGNEIKFGAGDFVEFPEGLVCTWHITKRIKKYYKFL